MKKALAKRTVRARTYCFCALRPAGGRSRFSEGGGGGCRATSLLFGEGGGASLERTVGGWGPRCPGLCVTCWLGPAVSIVAGSAQFWLHWRRHSQGRAAWRELCGTDAGNVPQGQRQWGAVQDKRRSAACLFRDLLVCRGQIPGSKAGGGGNHKDGVGLPVGTFRFDTLGCFVEACLQTLAVGRRGVE